MYNNHREFLSIWKYWIGSELLCTASTASINGKVTDTTGAIVPLTTPGKQIVILNQLPALKNVNLTFIICRIIHYRISILSYFFQKLAEQLLHVPYSIMCFFLVTLWMVGCLSGNSLKKYEIWQSVEWSKKWTLPDICQGHPKTRSNTDFSCCHWKAYRTQVCRRHRQHPVR